MMKDWYAILFTSNKTNLYVGKLHHLLSHEHRCQVGRRRDSSQPFGGLIVAALTWDENGMKPENKNQMRWLHTEGAQQPCSHQSQRMKRLDQGPGVLRERQYYALGDAEFVFKPWVTARSSGWRGFKDGSGGQSMCSEE